MDGCVTGPPYSDYFVRGTRLRKRPITLPPEENPLGFRPGPKKFAATASHPSLTVEELTRRPNKNAYRRLPLFWQLPEPLRPRAHQLLRKRLDEWRRWRGVVVVRGSYLYCRIVGGLIGALKSNGGRGWSSEEARELRAYRIAKQRMVTSLRRGTALLRNLHPTTPKAKRSKGLRKFSVLGEV